MANAFCHIELNTDDLAKAKKFYKSVFDWKLADAKGMPYTMIEVGKGTGGGMQKKMDHAPTSWIPYVEVDSVEKSLAKAAKAGANVVVPFTPIGPMGAIGVFVDPAGATLGVWEAAKKKAPAKKRAAAKKAKTAGKKK
jgi:predicted enzyme related to lactoylglutathione lyase